jgi:hypothetical protein
MSRQRSYFIIPELRSYFGGAISLHREATEEDFEEHEENIKISVLITPSKDRWIAQQLDRGIVLNSSELYEIYDELVFLLRNRNLAEDVQTKEVPNLDLSFVQNYRIWNPEKERISDFYQRELNRLTQN